MKKQQKYNGRYCTSHSKGGRSRKSLLSVALVLILAVCLTIGGTLAFLQQETGTVKNSFVAGNIEYTLKLIANAKDANEKYTDDQVGMPTELAVQSSTNLSVVFEPNKEPELKGYTFVGWSYDAGCTEPYPHVSGEAPKDITVNYGDTHDKNSKPNKVEIDLYADWKANQYEVVYKGNGSTSGQMENSTHTYDEAKNLTENAYERTGYAFLGWSQDPNATVPTYTDKESVMNLASEDDAKVNLYAVWKQMDFQVSFDTQAYDVPDPEDKTVTYEKPYGELPEVSRTGYTFDGWYLEKTGGEQITSESIVEKAEDHTLYAHWTPIQYTVEYKRNDEGKDVTPATGTTENSTHYYDEAKKLTANGYERTGYTFLGWNTKADGTGASYRDEEMVTNLSSVNNDVVTLYAQWGAKSYVLHYHANGGEGSMEDQIIKYDVPTNLHKNAFTKADYSFMGWSLTPDGEVKYIDEQTVVNLLETGELDLYAVWGQDSHTVYFDYNGGTGSPPSKQFQNGKAYGQLPEYPVHPTKEVSDSKIMTYLFTGWYTAKTGGTRVYPSTIANTTEDHTLYAHWEEAPSNQIITNMIVKNNPDDDKDGVVDDIYLEFTCTSNFEKYNIPLKNLVPGQVYELTYTASNDASFGDYEGGYKNSVYGSYILADSALTGGRIENNYDETAYVAQVLADWNSRKEADGVLGGDDPAINDHVLQGPWKNKKITFTAKASTMYWTWDFGLMQDNIQNNYNITDIVLKPVAPKINFGAGKFAIDNGAKITSKSNTNYSTQFTIDGESGCETYYWSITGLTPGAKYTLTFDHEVAGKLYDSASYVYGCGISSVVPTTGAATMNNIGANWISSPSSKVYSKTNQLTSTTFTFTPTGNTVYWIWNMGGCSDTVNCTTALNITNFKLDSGGKTITFHKSSSTDLLALAAHDELEFDFNIDIDELGAFANDMPTAGKDFIMEFFPAEGYAMPESVLVRIDGVDYTYTLDDLYAGTDDQDNDLYMLWIPGELLKNANTLYIEAKAVELDDSESDATEPSTEATEPSTEATEPSTEATEPSTEATEPSTEATEPSTEATEPSTEATEPSTEATEPSTEATEPSTEATEPSTEATAPSLEGNDGENVIDNFFDMIQKKKITNINQISDNDDVDPDEEVGE